MVGTPARSEGEIAANAAFDALLWALSRPGQIRALPGAGAGPIIDALLDRECRVYSADPRLLPQIMRVGAEVAEIAVADHVFLGRLTEASALNAVQIGSDLYPDQGASVVVQADLDTGARLRLTGPGVDGQLEVQVGGLPDGFWQARARRLRYPMGFDLFLLDGARVMGLPRSTNVEML